MAYAFQIKYFNSFWLKKVNGDLTEQPSGTAVGNSTVTTHVNAGVSDTAVEEAYYLPTWPSLPWATDLIRRNPDNNNIYQVPPIFPWGGRAGTGNTMAQWNNVQSIGLGEGSLLNTTPNAEVGRERNWFVEEARIDGGYNNVSVDFGVKAYLVEDSNNQELRFNALIHSGVYNSRTGINKTNVFSTATPITRALDPVNNSIQKLYASDTNLIVFQEDKVSQALIDKDVVYTAEGGTQTLPPGIVLGQITPYLGKYGISTNPESFGVFGFRKYFTDQRRNSVMRLSRDGLTEISKYGMVDFFRDKLNNIVDTLVIKEYKMTLFSAIGVGVRQEIALKNTNISTSINLDLKELKPGMLLSINGIYFQDLYALNFRAMNGEEPGATVFMNRKFNINDFGITGSNTISEVNFVKYVKDAVIGSYDNRNSNYVISIQKQNILSSTPSAQSPTVDYSTLAFEEDVQGWVSFYNYMPTDMFSLQNKFFSMNEGDIYMHYDEVTENSRGLFYNERYESSVEFVFNSQPQVSKNFQTINYEGSNGWQVDFMLSDPTGDLKPGSNWYTTNDTINKVLSYYQGSYIDPNTGQNLRSGFYLKENKYYANLLNDSEVAPGEVTFGNSMSGIKGYYSTVRMSTDNTTNLGGEKQLFSVGSKYVVSSY